METFSREGFNEPNSRRTARNHRSTFLFVSTARPQRPAAAPARRATSPTIPTSASGPPPTTSPTKTPPTGPAIDSPSPASARIDGKPYRFMGAEPRDVPAMEQLESQGDTHPHHLRVSRRRPAHRHLLHPRIPQRPRHPLAPCNLSHPDGNRAGRPRSFRPHRRRPHDRGEHRRRSGHMGTLAGALRLRPHDRSEHRLARSARIKPPRRRCAHRLGILPSRLAAGPGRVCRHDKRRHPQVHRIGRARCRR